MRKINKKSMFEQDLVSTYNAKLAYFLIFWVKVAFFKDFLKHNCWTEILTSQVIQCINMQYLCPCCNQTYNLSPRFVSSDTTQPLMLYIMLHLPEIPKMVYIAWYSAFNKYKYLWQQWVCLYNQVHKHKHLKSFWI
jgi:hypothetical protein